MISFELESVPDNLVSSQDNGIRIKPEMMI